MNSFVDVKLSKAQAGKALQSMIDSVAEEGQ
jgi:hypothetical protein